MRIISALAALGLVAGLSGAALADTDQVSTGDQASVLATDEPAQMTDQEMDEARGGIGTFAGPTFYTRVIDLGSYSLVYNGTTWTRVKNF